MKGMTEDELTHLCDPKRALTGIAPWIYWTSEQYGNGKYFREYAMFPRFLPLCVYTDHSHGVNGTDIPASHELSTNAPVFLVFSKAKAQIFRNMTGKRSYVIISPAIYYRRKYGISCEKQAKGTVAFSAHSTPDVDNVSNIEKYAMQLLALPEKFQPVTVCLHMSDIHKGQHRVFMKYGLPVVTVGHVKDNRFIERFYSILKNHAYSTSNAIGSYTSLSIEMGITFFIYGEEPHYVNVSDPNLPFGLFNPYENQPLYEIMYEKSKFDSVVTINDELRSVIEDELGVFSTIGRWHACAILWASFFYCIFNPFFWLWAVKTYYSKLNRQPKFKCAN